MHPTLTLAPHHDSCMYVCLRSLSSIISDEKDATLTSVVTLVAVGRGSMLLQVGQPRPLLSHYTQGKLENSVAQTCSSVGVLYCNLQTFYLRTVLLTPREGGFTVVAFCAAGNDGGVVVSCG